MDLPTTVDRPLLTYHDDATGEHVELSAVELGRWAARTAVLLHEGCGLAVGAQAAVLLPPHWTTAAVVMGAWSAGLTVSFRLAATGGLMGSGDPADVVFVDSARADSWLEEIPEAPHRFILGGTKDGYRDYLAEVGRYPDSLPSYAPIRTDTAATMDGTTYGQWGSLAAELAESMDLRAGDRVLVDTAEHEHPVKWLLAPLSVGASVILCANRHQSHGATGTMAPQNHGATRIL
jgi:uncharacterized protein (TIGR03089 family)